MATPQQQQEWQILAKFNDAVKAVRADRKLSDEGKRAAIAALTVQRDQRVGTLREQAAATQARNKQALEGILFRVPQDQQGEFVQYLAAAESLDKPEAFERALNRAGRHGNKLLQQALAEVAYDKGHPEYLHQFHDFAGHGQSFAEWHALQTPPALETRVRDRMNTDAVNSTPDELARLSDRAIQDLANGSQDGSSAAAA